MTDTVSLKKNYSALNERLAKLYDESGVRRSFTVPYIEGQAISDHISAVGQAASQNGGLTSNLVTSAHHSGGKGWGSGDGQTVGHPVEKLRQTIIPKEDENAKAVIAAAQKCITDFKFLLGDDDSSVQTAQGQLNLIKPTAGAGMNLQDFGVLVIQIMNKPTQEVAKAHSSTKSGGHAPQLRGPGPAAPSEGQEQPETAQGAPQEGEQAPIGTQEVSAPQGAPAAAPAQG